jgi:Ca2+-binding EF-hand superfamily protein
LARITRHLDRPPIRADGRDIMMNTARHLALLAVALLPATALAAAPPGSTDAVPIGLRILFVAVDRNADGKIDQGEADQFVDRLFAQADSNADGVLSLKEVKAMQATLAPGATNAKAIETTFRQIDRNRDGVVDGREANKAAVGHFAFLDANGDGAVSLPDLAGRDLIAPPVAGTASN